MESNVFGYHDANDTVRMPTCSKKIRMTSCNITAVCALAQMSRYLNIVQLTYHRIHHSSRDRLDMCSRHIGCRTVLTSTGAVMVYTVPAVPRQFTTPVPASSTMATLSRARFATGSISRVTSVPKVRWVIAEGAANTTVNMVTKTSMSVLPDMTRSGFTFVDRGVLSHLWLSSQWAQLSGDFGSIRTVRHSHRLHVLTIIYHN